MTRTTEAAVTWPATSFYWAVLDAPGYRRSGPLPPGLVAVLADEVPQPVEELFAVGMPVSGGRVLACATRRENLAALPANTRELTPDGLPPALNIDAHAACLNLLVGEFEPAPVRRERRRRHLLRAAAVLLVTMLLVTGLARRASHWRTAATDARRAQSSLAANLFTPGTPPEHAVMALDGELDRLREVARSKPKAPTDATLQLVSLLQSWPAATPSKPQSVAVNESGITVSVSVDGDPAPFLSAFKVPTGWNLDEPRLNSAGDVTRMTLRLRPAAPAVAAGGEP